MLPCTRVFVTYILLYLLVATFHNSDETEAVISYRAMSLTIIALEVYCRLLTSPLWPQTTCIIRPDTVSTIIFAALADQDHETHGANNTHHALLHVSKMIRKSQPKIVSSSTSLNWLSISVSQT